MAVTMLSTRDVRNAVAGILEANRAEIDERLQRVVADLETQSILPYFTANLDVGMFPLLMIEQVRDKGEWVGMPSISNNRFELVLWGLIHHNDPQVQDDLAAELAAGVKQVLNRRHLPIGVGEFEIYFNDTMPIPMVEYGAAQLGNQVVAGFRGEYRSDVEITLKDVRNGI